MNASVSGQAPDDSPERADFRLLPAVGGIWAAAQFGLAFPGGPAVAAAAGLAGLGASALLLMRRRKSRLLPAITAALVCAAVSLGVASARASALSGGPLTRLSHEQAVGRAQLVLTADPERRVPSVRAGRPGRPSIVIRARLESIEARGKRWTMRRPVIVIGDDSRWLGLLPGQRITATGRLSPARPGEGVGALLLVRGPPGVVGVAPLPQRIAGHLRSGLRNSVAGLPPPERGLIPGLVVGDKSGLTPELEGDFTTAGLTHLLAVSGANLAIVLAFVMFGARWLGVRGWGRPALGLLVITAFAILARPQPSVLRAAAMGVVAVVAMWRGRARNGFAVLMAAAGCLLLMDPWLARSYGFALSVLATAGLVLFAVPLSERLSGVLPPSLALALAVPTAATLVCAPVVVMLSGQLSLVAIPANLLAAPAVAPATILGVFAAATAPVAGGLSEWLGELAGLPAWWIVFVARRAAGVPHATLAWIDGVAGGVSVLLLLGTAALGYRWLRRRRALAVAAVGTVAGVLFGSAVIPGWPPPDWLMVACDVGQGDGLILNAGDDRAVVVDAGPDPRAIDTCLRDLGIREIPLLLLTHLHADHVEGVPGVLRRRRVARIEWGPLAEPSAEAARVSAWAAAAGLSPVRVAAGSLEAAGDLKWQIIWPARIIRGEESAPNNASLVLIVEIRGVRLLLTGDVEPAAQGAILASARNLRVDVLKVPHHGSAHQSPEFLAAAHPRVAVISVGADNDYGHPGAATLARLRAAGALVARTDTDGSFAVAGGDRQLRVVRRHG